MMNSRIWLSHGNSVLLHLVVCEDSQIICFLGRYFVKVLHVLKLQSVQICHSHVPPYNHVESVDCPIKRFFIDVNAHMITDCT